jgi:dipeptidyl aminopeptidase/acylaminoacyl peptidase
MPSMPSRFRSAWGGVALASLGLAACTSAPVATPAVPQPPASEEHPAMSPASAPAGLPPLIDRDLFFGDPQIAASQISPDGRFLSFVKPYRDILNIWVKGLAEPFDAARPMTADTERPVTSYFWSEDGKYLLYEQDKGGNENFHVYAVDPGAAPEESTGVPPARDLTPLENVRATIYAVPERTPHQIIVGLNDRDPALHDVYQLDVETGERRLLVENDQNVAAWITDLDGKVRLAFRQTPDGGTELLRVEGGKLGKAVYSCSFEETCDPLRFDAAGERLYVESNKGEGVDLTRLMLLDPATGETTLVESDPEHEVDFGGAIFSDKTEELIGTLYLGDRLRLYPRSAWLKQVMARLEAQLPDGEITIGSLTNDDRYVKVVVTRDVDPGTVYLYDDTSGQVTELYKSRPELPTDELAPMQALRYRARDGQQIPAYLTTPKGLVARNLPTVILPHGGPWSRDLWEYDPIHQFLANRGYAVLSMNFRGSTGYGKAFLNAGNGEWGTGVMQHDITDGVRYLVAQGIADPARVAIMGGSYGGFATLAGVAFTPDLYAAGVDIAGPANIISLLNSIPPYWGPMRKIFALRVGDPDVPADAERLKAQSPFFHAADIKAPLLIVQGANDPRVKQAEPDQIVVALREAGRDVSYLVAPDEGHGFHGRDNRLAMFAEIEKFLAGHIGGRYQESMAPAVATKLAAMTVDVASVQMPKQASGADAALTSPLPAVVSAAVVPGEIRYARTIHRGEQQMHLDGVRTVSLAERAGQAIVEIASSAEGPMGKVSDTYELQADSLLPIRRQVRQGPVAIDLDYAAKQVTGQMQAGPQKMPIDVALEAPVFGDGAALETVAAALPLGEGYSTALRTFEVGMQQRVRPWLVEVSGSEEVTVPAATYETWKVEIKPLDGEGGGQTLWISKQEPHLVVKSIAQLPPAAGGGEVSTELTGWQAASP